MYDPEFQDLVKKFPLKKDGVLLHQPYEQLKEHLWDLANTRGYFQAKFLRHSIELDLLSDTASIQVIFASGPRYRFGKISLKQDVLDDELVRRFIPFKEGDFYSADDLLKLQNNLSNVYFSSASIEPHPTTTPFY